MYAIDYVVHRLEFKIVRVIKDYTLISSSKLCCGKMWTNIVNTANIIFPFSAPQNNKTYSWRKK